MPHNRYLGFKIPAKKHRNRRNLDNLHVIPTVGPKPSAPPPLFYQAKKNTGKRRERRRKREIKHLSTVQPIKEQNPYRWINSNYVNNEKPPDEKVETTECSPEPPVEESYFEEVEVASYETEGAREIPVGFRKTKIHYLKYKRNCFFKPKIYKFGAQRTIVNCLNIQNNSTDIDVVSEAEYEIDCETDKSEKCGSEEDMHMIVEENEASEDVEQFENCLGVEKKVQDSGLVKEKDIIVKSGSRNYNSSIKNEQFDLYQGKSLDQKSLDSWKSHLIGMEYVIEIQNGKKDTVMKYHCALCNDDLAVEGFPSICVINHINGYKHMVKYLGKHFPACGSRFNENSNHDDNIIIQKLCDAVNRNLGYSFMCITNLDQYKNNKQKIIDIILDAHHFNEDSLKLDDELTKTVDSILLEEANVVLNDVIEQIKLDDSVNPPSPEVQIVYEKLNSGSNSEACLKSAESQNKSECSEIAKDTSSVDASKPPPRAKRSKSLASYLKLKHATARFERSKVSSKTGNRNQGKKKEAPSETSVSEQKTDSNNISESKTLEGSEPSVPTVEDDTAEITMNVRGDEAEVSQVSKIPKIIKSNASQKLIYKIRERALQKQTAHSKHCRKRILSKEISRLRMPVKTRGSESVGDVINETSVQYHSADHHSASERIISEKKRDNSVQELKHLSSMTSGSSSHKSESPLRKVSAVPVHKGTKGSIGSKSSVKGHSIENIGVLPKNVHKCSEISMSTADAQVRDIQSHRKVTKVSRSPKHSKSPVQRIIRRHSRSPVRRIKSPLRVVRSPVRKSPIRRHSRSPVRKIKSPLRVVRSPVRRHSRSPVRRHSRSPVRRHSRSPVRRHSRSPLRRLTRSPIRRRSRSPIKRRSRSPIRRHSRSPIRRYSRSPVRRLSRSPVRRYSRSPLRRRSKSPFRRHSRSPGYRKSRSPYRRRSRTPLKRHSRSPVRRYSRSPVKRRSRSPLKRHSRSPHRSPVIQSKSSYRGYSPPREHPRSFQGNINSHDKYSSPHKQFNTHELSLNNKGTLASKSDKYHKMYSRISGMNRDVSDLDPVSDEDESIYFNTSDKRQHAEDPKMPSSRVMLAQLLQKCSVTDANPNDPTLKKLMHFLESHSDELQDLMSPHHSSDKRNPLKVDRSVQERNTILQQYLLSNLAGNSQESLASAVLFPATPNLPPDFSGPPFVQDRTSLPPYGLPPHPMQDPPQSSHNQSRYFPPNINVPPPEHFHQFSHAPQGLSPKPKVPQENMFKDLKATVSKLFGANESSVKQEKIKPNLPVYVTQPDPAKWDLNHPNAPKFMPTGPKDIFHVQGKNLDFHSIPGGSGMRSNMPVPYKNNSGPMHFFSRGVDRPQLPNVAIPPPDTKVAFCEGPSTVPKGNLFPVVNNMQGNPPANPPGNVSDVKISLAQRLASVLVKVGMIDVPAPLLQEMLMKIGAFSSSPPQDIRETEIVSILKRLGYLS